MGFTARLQTWFATAHGTLCWVLVAAMSLWGASNPASAAFEISIDSRDLAPQFISVSGVASGESTDILSVMLEPGSYRLTSAGDAVDFSVLESGLLDYSSALDLFVKGRGSSTLKVEGFDIEIDALSLSEQFVAVLGNGNKRFTFTSDALVVLGLMPKSDYVLTSAGDDLVFSVSPAGGLDFDSQLDSFVGGRGTASLEVSGFDIEVDALSLSEQFVAVLGNGNKRFPFVSTTPTVLGLMPKSDYVFTSAGDDFAFSVSTAGILGFGPHLDSFVDGRGTASLEVVGFTIDIDALSLSEQFVAVLGNGNKRFTFTSDVMTSLGLMPKSDYVFTSAGDDFVFSVSAGGIVDFGPQLDGFVGGRGTAFLEVRGFDIDIDARSLNEPFAAVLGSGNKRFSFAGDILTVLGLMPKVGYSFEAAGDAFHFDLGLDGVLRNLPETFLGFNVLGEATDTLAFGVGHAPVADAGPDQALSFTHLVDLDGSESFDPDGDLPLSFSWSFAEKPAGSSAELVDPMSAQPSFVADIAGIFELELVVTDSQNQQSSPDRMTVHLDPTWTLAGIGNANQVSALEVADGEGNVQLALTADGATAFYGADNAGFFYREIVGDFRIETTIDGTLMSTGGQYRKAGLMVRASLDKWDIRLLTLLLPYWQNQDETHLQFVARAAYGQPGRLPVARDVVGVPRVVRLAVQRRGQSLTVEYSLDGGTTWIVPRSGFGGSIEIVELPQALLVGLAMVSNDISVTSTALFDDVLIESGR